MELFGSGSSDSAAQSARLQLKTWEAGLSLRISLQRSMDLFNRLPVEEDATIESVKCGVATEELLVCLASIVPLLELQQPKSEVEVGSKKRKFDVLTADNDDIWDHIHTIQSDMLVKWKPVIDKWHARLNYGSEQSKSKLKILSSTIWEQIDRALSDESVVIDKSRPLLMVSKRIGKPSNEHRPSTARDEEVYDDTHFYSMLLKMLIQANISSANISEGDAEWTALQNFRRQSQRLDVDRRASKGRKIRYVPHPKLENFMFPVQRVADVENEIASLSTSLFQ